MVVTASDAPSPLPGTGSAGRYGKAEVSIDPGRPCALVVEIEPKVSGNDPQQSVRTCARTGA